MIGRAELAGLKARVSGKPVLAFLSGAEHASGRLSGAGGRARRRLMACLAMTGGLALPAQLMAEEADRRADIVVTGTRTARSVRDAPIRTDVVGGAILQSTGSRNLADALDYLPGARSESNCQNCNTTEIQLLGLPGAYNQILLDGLPLVTGVAAVYGVEQLPAVLIDRIEVMKGGGSALYGPGALAGVVNVLPVKPTRSGLRASIDYARLGGANALTGSVMGSFALPGGDIVSLYVQGASQPAVDLNGDGYSELARLRQKGGGIRGAITLTSLTQLKFDYQYTDERRRGGNRFDQAPYLANIAEAIDSRIHRASLSLDHRLGDRTMATVTYALSRISRNSFYGGLGDVETDPEMPGFDSGRLARAIAVSRRQYGTTRDTLNYGELRLATSRGAHELQIGVQARSEKVDDRNVDVDGTVLGTLTSGSFSTVGAFVQDEWTLSSAARLLLGARVDRSSVLDGLILSPRIGLWWSPDSAWVIRANWSSGYRAPEIFSEDVHVAVLGAAPVRVRNAPRLAPERAASVSLGFDWRPNWSDGRLTVDGQVYLTRLRDAFMLGGILQDAGGLFQLRDNAGGSRVLGAEINASLRITERLRVAAGGAWIDARYDSPQKIYQSATRQIFTRGYLKSPHATAVGQMSWTLSQSLEAFLALRYIGSMHVLNNRLGVVRSTPALLVADMSATRHVHLSGDREVDITIGLRNITDARQRDLETGPIRDSDYVYGPRGSRTMFVQARAHF
ncbi:TonB-dependent receptor [Sphingobium sp.]|uniref:TonB-dependent receptor plug domain-containing protein n=1 Tax=Sphingobium sp. TaxID=1912891 RepID=UPI0028BD4C3F|nr:TonB-dependent receptor [Sphingobium sp.]